jgi:hypothetical protein
VTAATSPRPPGGAAGAAAGQAAGAGGRRIAGEHCAHGAEYAVTACLAGGGTAWLSMTADPGTAAAVAAAAALLPCIEHAEVTSRDAGDPPGIWHQVTAGQPAPKQPAAAGARLYAVTACISGGATVPIVTTGCYPDAVLVTAGLSRLPLIERAELRASLPPGAWELRRTWAGGTLI